MKVKELILALQELDPEREVYLQSDPEGNSYEPVRGAESCSVEIDGREINCGIEKLTEGLMKQGFTEEDIFPELGVVVFP